MVCFTCRAVDFRFEELELTSYEARATADEGLMMRGFLVWRRTLLLACTAAMVSAVGNEA